MQSTVENNRGKKFNPFPGLRPFGIEESYLYFGREGQSDEVLAILEKNRFVNILGSSGTGKSSLMFSGVIPTLHGGFISKAGNEWEVISAKPGLNPIKNLADGFKNHIESHKDFQDKDNGSKGLINEYLFNAVLQKSTKGLSELYRLNKYLKGKNLLIYIDQFEEIFRFRKLGETNHINESLAYVNLILEAIKQTEVPIYIALSMRSDFLGDCEQFPELTNQINESHYLIPQMTREQKKLVITGPVAVGEAKISNRLVQRLLNDMGDRFDQLPVLQHALMRTWDYWSASDKNEQLDFLHYEAIGGVNEALSRHADEAFYELNEEEKIICEKIFKTITEKRSDNDGIRRPTPLSEISRIVDEEEHILTKIIDKFRIEGRALLTPRENIPLNSQSVIDISHEALMRVWYRLRNWVQKESESAQIYLRLSEAANKYQQGSGGLWRPPDLQLAVEWRNTTKPTLKWALQYENNFEAVILFLDKSEESYKKELQTKELLQKRRLKRSKVIATVLGTAAVLSLIFLFYAFNQSALAEKQREIAENKSQEALRNEEIAKENELKAQRQQIEANRSSRRAENERRRAELSNMIAQEARKTEEIARKQSERSAAEAQRNLKLAQDRGEEIANTNTQLTEEKKNSTQLSMRAIAQSLAVKSEQMEEDQLQGLLALYGFVFNINNEGYDSNNDIYNGLFYALKNFDDDYFNAFNSTSTDVRSLQFVKGKYLYTTGTSGRINFWEVENMSAKRSIVIFEKEGVFVKKIFVDEENQSLVALTDGSDFYVIDVSERIRKVNKYTLPDSYAFDVTFKKGSTDFYLSASDMKIYEFKNNKIEPYFDAGSRIYDMELINNNLLATGNNQGKVEIWDLEDKKSKIVIREANQKNIHSLSVGNGTLAVGDNSGQVNLFYLKEDFTVASSIILRGSDGEIMTDIEFNKAENQLIAASTKGTIRMWNLNDPDEFPMIINEPGSWVNAIALMDESHIFAGCKDQVFRLYPIKSELLAESLKKKLSRDITPEEWDRYIGDDLPYNPILKESKFINPSR